MSGLSYDSWKVLSPYLDHALGMMAEEREIWMASLHGQNPVLARQLDTLLSEHRALTENGFLERHDVELPSAPTLAGQTVGAYRLISQIGQGGTSSVWLAERNDGHFQRRVALKFLNIALMGKTGEGRFKREGRILGLLVHPHIAELIDAGVSQTGQPYLVLDYVDGEQIDSYCDRHRLEIHMRIRLFLDVLAAVSQAHTNRIVHRDLKPSNVLVRNDNHVKLLDFGIAKLLEDEGHAEDPTQLTVGGERAMTPEYAAPEQLKGEPVTTATDVYALGVLLYVLLTGHHPNGRGPHPPAALIKAVVEMEPMRPSEVVRRSQDFKGAARNARRRATTTDRLSRLLRGDLDTIIAKALKKEPARRYSSVTALADDLRRYLRNEPISVRSDPAAYRARKFVRRNRVAVVLVTIAVAVAASGVAGMTVQARWAREQ
jgi:eukaryotic-like serine/threonine-protein kinase